MAIIRTNIKPTSYEWLIEFMSTVELNEENKNLLIKAFLNYHKTCLQAAKQLEKDLNSMTGVKVKK